MDLHGLNPEELRVDRASLEAVRQGFEASPFGVIFYDAAGVITMANPAAARILGLAMDQLLGRTTLNPRWGILREDGTPFPDEESPVRVALRTGRAVGEVLLGVANPELEGTCWLQVSACPLFQPGDPRPYQVMVSILDVTAARQAEQEMRQGEERFRTFFEANLDAVFIRTLDGAFLEANGVALRRYGYSLKELRTMRYPDLSPPRLRDRAEAAFLQGVGAGHAVEWVHRAKDGTEIPVELMIHALDMGGVPCVITRARDLTEQKRHEEHARLTESRLEAALASMTDAVVITDVRERVLICNAAFRERYCGPGDFGMAGAIEEARQQVVVFLPDGTPVARDQLAAPRALRGETGTSVEYEVTRRDSGASFLVSASFAPIRDGEGAIVGAVVSSRDITAQRQAELHRQVLQGQLEELLADQRRTQEEERLRIAREIHDDLGQLLTAIQMDLRWLERKFSAPDLPPSLNPVLDRVVGTTELADAMIAAVQRIASQLRTSPVAQLGLEAALTLEVQRFQERSGLVCTVTRDQDCPVLSPEVAGHVFHICREALTNVGRHALATRVALGWGREAGAAVFTLADDGLGMPTQDPLLKPAIGLAGMRERASLCGGTLTFETNPPQGTRVTLRVPLEAPPGKGSPAP